MGKNKISYVCSECGYQSSNWMGRCTNCGTWNSFVESVSSQKQTNQEKKKIEEITPHPISEIKTGHRARFSSGINELDRVLGGGIVAGSLILLGGAPGIGKSTLILQAASLFSNKFGDVLYISGEESARQIKLRADRLNILSDNLFLLAETNFQKLLKHLSLKKDYDFIVIDSIQTIYNPELSAAPGSISQIKEITNQLLKVAKKSEVPIVLIGHVTKEGELAGPRVLEHLVDTVLYFEGDRNYSYRILRAVKNRYGSTNELGVFEMSDKGMKEVGNPSKMFLQGRPEGVSGSVIVPVIEGSRTLLVEVQALVSTAAFGTPQRITTGVDRKRLSMLLAVLEKKAGFPFQSQDIHCNITGGIKVDEPALDLGIAIAAISSFEDYILPSDTAVVGEIGLAGEVRAVSQIERRIKELKKMGFNDIVIPDGNWQGIDFDPELNLKGVKNIDEVLQLSFPEKN